MIDNLKDGWTLVLFVQLMLIAIIDLRWQIIPNASNVILGLSGAVHAYLNGSLLSAGVAAVVIFSLIAALSFLYTSLRKRQGLGFGDVKFLSAAATWVGLMGMPWVVLIGSISGLVYAVVLSLIGKPLAQTTRIAFGPHLALGLMLTWVLRDVLVV